MQRKYTLTDINDCIKIFEKQYEPSDCLNVWRHFDILKKGLLKNPHLRFYNLPLNSCFNSKNILCPAVINPIIEKLGVTKLNLNHNNLNIQQINQLVRPHVLQLKELNLEGNNLFCMGVDWQEFKGLLASSNITHLNIRNCDLDWNEESELNSIIKQNNERIGREYTSFPLTRKFPHSNCKTKKFFSIRESKKNTFSPVALFSPKNHGQDAGNESSNSKKELDSNQKAAEIRYHRL